MGVAGGGGGGEEGRRERRRVCLNYTVGGAWANIPAFHSDRE